jgi:hypothetical protein
MTVESARHGEISLQEDGGFSKCKRGVDSQSWCKKDRGSAKGRSLFSTKRGKRTEKSCPFIYSMQA